MGKFVNYTVLNEIEQKSVEKLLKVYREDKYKARVYYFNNLSKDKPSSDRLVVFENDDDTYEIVMFKKSWGVSKTNKIYAHQKKIWSIFKSKKGYYFLVGKQIRPLMFRDLLAQPTIINNSIYEYMVKDFSPLEIIKSNHLLISKSFNYIIKHKLTSYKKMLRYTYKANYSVSESIHNLEAYKSSYFSSVLTNKTAYYKNINNLNFELVNNDSNFHVLRDTINMAETTNNVINLAWSLKRLKLEHDKMAIKIAEMLYDVDNQELNVNKNFVNFANFSGYRLLTDTKSLALEGLIQSHCVGSYVDSVNYGYSGIYHIKGYTLELRFVKNKNGVSTNQLHINQFRGKGNCSSPEVLFREVSNKLDEYHKSIDIEVIDDLNISNSFELIF